jgi:hypothetical protein
MYINFHFSTNAVFEKSERSVKGGRVIRLGDIGAAIHLALDRGVHLFVTFI